MTIERFRDMGEAQRALWLGRDDPRLFGRIRRLWDFAARLAPGRAPRGLRRFRTPEEACLDRDAWLERRALALRAARVRRAGP